MSKQVFKLESSEWIDVIAHYLGNKYPHLPYEANVVIKINRRTQVMTIEVEGSNK